MRYDTTQNPLYKQWAADIIGVKEFGPSATIAFFSDDLELQAVVVYNRLSDKNCELNLATVSPKCFIKITLKIAFSIPFQQYNLNRITTMVRSDNKKAVKLNERLGMKRIGELEQYYADGQTAYLYGMLKNECRWI